MENDQIIWGLRHILIGLHYLPVCLSVPKEMEVDLTVSSSVLRQGEVLTINCTVKDAEMVYFTWDFPRRQVPVYLSEYPSLLVYGVTEFHWQAVKMNLSLQEIEPLTDFLPNRICSFINISTATVSDSGRFLLLPDRPHW